MRVVLSLLILLGVLMMGAPASAQPSAAATAHSQNVGLVQKVDDRRYNDRRPNYGPRYRSGYYRPYYPPPYAYAYPYPYPYPYPNYAPAPYYPPRAGVSLSFGF